jgi:hypothetical protein
MTTIILAAALPVAGILGYALRSYFGKNKIEFSRGQISQNYTGCT